MRLVRLADLSDEERRKALEEQQERLNKNRQESQNIQNEANQKFNDYVSRYGAYDTNKNTTTIGDLRKAYRNTPSYNNIKTSTNDLYRNSIWNDVKNTFNNLMVNEKQRNNTYNRGNQSIDQQALEQNNNANFIMQMQNVNKAYRQDQEDKLKGSIAYKQAKLNNPNVSDKELLKIAQNENTKLDNGLLKDISSKNGAERIQEIKSISKSQSNPLFYDNNKFRKINNSVLQYKIAEESQEQANKINKDLKNGKISSSVEHVLEALPTKAMEAVASPIYATGSLMNLKLPTGTADQDLQDWKAISSKYDQTTGNIESGLVRSASNVSGTIGYMIPSILASAIAPETNLGRITQGVSVGGQSYIETLNDDASNKLQSALTGLGKGTASYAIEGIAGGNILGKGSLDDLAVKTIASKTSNEASKKIASMVYEVGGEVFEEELENQVDYLVDKIVNDKGISLKEWLTEQNETVKSTIASTLVLKLLGLGGNTYKDVKEYEYNADTKKWINEAEKIIKKENLQFDIDKLKEKNNQAQNIIDNNSTQNLQQNTIQNQINQQMQQVTPVQNENASNLDMITNNLKDEAINEIKNSKILETSKKEMLEVLNNIDNVTENDLNAIKQTINEVNESELETNITYKDSLARKRNYIKYKDDTNTYDSKAVNEVLDSMPSNRNGNRTVKQWLQVANELGKRISDKSNSEIEQIAYKSWFDVQPSKNITKYDNVNKTNVGFQKLTADNWINAINNAVLQEREQIIQQQNKMTQNGNIGQLNDITISTTEKQVKSIIKDFNESAKQYNIDYSNEDLKEINQMFNKRGIKAYFDENTFKNNNDVFSVWKPVIDEQGNVSGREVVFNPKAKDSKVRVQELAIHELGHDLDLNEVQDMILKDASRKENWESARKSLENTYREAYNNDGINISEEDFNKIVDEEATMSILQRELGSQEYVNRLVNQNQSIAKKIYNWVIDKLNKFTGGRNEKIFWADIKNKFETAYNQEFNKNDNTAKFSIAGKKSLENIKNDSYSYSRGINSYNNAINLAKQNIDNEQIRQKTGWFQDKNGDWKYEFSDRDMALKNIKIKSDKTYKLSDILEHDTLFTLYPQLKELKVQVKNMDKIGGNYNKNNKSITLSTNSIKNNKVTEGTLIHEIQHAIQDIEGHELGTTSKLSKKNYYESLGEIEADNTRTRFVNEKYNNMDISNVAPESSKINPKHRLYDHYMNNRNTIDKIKDSMFKYFKRLGDSNEGYQETNQENIQQSNRLVDDGRNGRHVESENNSGSFNLQENKQKQLEIIQKNNKMQDDYHTGIRTVEDIKTLEETLQDSDWSGYDEFNPDYTRNMANEALKTGKITVYSSYPIKQGTFVSPSKMEAESYSGNGKVYSKEININDVAWIDPTQGQYANINQKYALPTKEWQQFIEYNYQKQGTGKNLKEYNLPTKEDVKTKLNLPIKENINKQDNQTTQGEKIDWNEIERPEGKIRKHYRSIIESSNTTKEAKAIAKELMGTDTYVPETNKGQLAQADYRINNSSPEAELKSLMNRVIQGEKVSSVDIAVGERLIQYYSKIGDKTNLQEAIQTTAMAGTSAGQTVQALAMLNHQTPEGQATWIQRSVDKMNNELAKRKGGTITKDEEGNIKVVNKQGKDITDKVDLFELTPDMIDKIVSSKNKTEMYDNIDQVYEDLGQQVPLSTMEKIDSWRYFSMLANPKTHIRNMVGNVAMGKTQSLKDKLAGGIEDIVGTFNKDMERTKTLRPADAKTKEFAKNDVLNPDVQSMMELNENKYNPQSRLQNARKTFKNDALENTLGRLFNWNDKLLEAEDTLGLKSNYKKALANYLTANKIDVDNITDKQLSKARNYAVEQAKEATFHQANSLATWINQASTNNKIVKSAKDAILPFVKTPLNVAKTGIEYNPVGLLKTITYDTVKLRKGDITVNKYIDNLSKGLTGTGIAVLGYALADAGILKASGGDDDKKEKYDEALGKQTYSITIGDRTYSLDWLAPVGIPLFVGAEAKAMKDSNKEEKSSISSDDDKKFNQAVNSLENLANAMANSMSPMSEMSMISGLTSALKSYEQDSTKMLGTIGTNAVKSYANQFVPTLLGQVARTTDDYERSTTSTKSGVLSKAIDQTKLQIMSKVPGLRQKLPTKEDIWGNEQKAEPNIPLRVVNNFVNPSTVKNINTSKVDEELDNLYNKTGESTILPSTIEKTYTINGQTYRMTNEEYSKYKKNYGQTSYKLLDDLINSNDYNKLSDEQKQKAIENIYSYAKEVNKVDYAKNNNEIVKTSTLYDTLEELKQKGGNQSSYLNYIAKTKDITGEDSSKKKIEVLANSDYSDKTKEIIYKNTEGSNDKKIILVDKLKLPINEYLNYKSQKFENDKDTDGETISGSKKQKVYNYLNSISNKELSQDYKKIICKIENINDYDNDIVNFINNSKNLNYSERTEILKDIGFKIDKDGKIQTKSMIPIYKYVK